MSSKKNSKNEKFEWAGKSAKREEPVRDSSTRKPGRRNRSETGASSDGPEQAKSPWARAGKKDRGAGSGKSHGKNHGNRKPHRKTEASLIGKVSAHPDGFGFVDVEGREKGLFLPPDQMRDLMHGDTVEVQPVQSRGRESAEVIRIVEHAPNIIVGQFEIKNSVGLVQPRSRKMPQAIMITRSDAGAAKDGDWVRIKIKRGSGQLRGQILEVLGDNLTPCKLIDLIVAELQLEEEFPATVFAESLQFSDTVDEAEFKGRKDLRHLPFVTIDGEDARDFDDAICVLPRGEGFEAWVTIADVAHYVKARSALDKEALERSNSFYFPDRVIPMLPEKLSNGLCSLNPHVARLGMTVRMRFDANGSRRSIHVYESVIHSQARLTYTQAAAWLEKGDESAVEKPEIRQMLDDTARLFRKLENKRKHRGALDLDMPEVRAILKDDVVLDIVASDRNIAHRLIEEMMLAANTAVAEYMEQHHCELLYRIHPAPEREAIEKLNEYLAPFDLFVALPKANSEDSKVKPGNVQRILEKSEGKPFAHVLHRLVLRSMQQAKYTPNNEGHFGLAYDSYAHFTSPIRRYADLIVHRRLKALIRKEDPNRAQPANTLAEIGLQTSTQERKQQRGEWDTQAMLAALFHAKDVGKTMPARIAGLTKRRIFFEIEPTMAEGGLNVDDLPGSFVLDDKGHQLTAKAGGLSYHLGDQLNVIIDSTDPVRGQINVRIAPTTE